MEQGFVTKIKHFAVHDGDGIRTTVFLKGCPLRCIWCHNPEGLDFAPQMAYVEKKCIGCMQCVPVCESNAQQAADGKHRFVRELCVSCGKCERVCLGGAMELNGRLCTVEEIMPELLQDRDFYGHSGGGITISGGECLAQPGFVVSLLQKGKEYGINMAVDTCGFVKREVLDAAMPYTDTFLYDVKAIDNEVHIKCTGKPNDIILENLKYLDHNNCRIEVRIPYVPGYNSDQISLIAEFLVYLHNLSGVRVLPYHNYAGSKYKSLGMTNHLPLKMPTLKDIINVENRLKKKGLPIIKQE